MRQNGRLAFETRSSQSFIFIWDCHMLCPIIIILLFLIVMKNLSYLVLGVFEKLPKKPGKVKDFSCCLNMKHTVPSENLYKVGLYTSLSYILNEQKIFTTILIFAKLPSILNWARENDLARSRILEMSFSLLKTVINAR